MRGVGKQLPWHSPQRDAKTLGAYCARADSEVSMRTRGQPVSLLQVARLDEHAGSLFKVGLAKGGPTQHVIHSFILQTLLKSLLGLHYWVYTLRKP